VVEALVRFDKDLMYCNDMKIERSMYGWHVNKPDGELYIAVSDIEDAINMAMRFKHNKESN